MAPEIRKRPFPIAASHSWSTDFADFHRLEINYKFKICANL